MHLALTALLITQSFVYAAQPKLTVILDPGHGGEDAGATRKIHGRKVVAEKNITLAIARQAWRLLRARGISVVLTRTKDTTVSLDHRVEIANLAGTQASSAVFISIHANSSDEEKSSGIETYVFNAATNEASKRLADLENGKHRTASHPTLTLILNDLATTANFGESATLACIIQKSAAAGMVRYKKNLRDRGVRQALFYVLMQTRMPGVLFEPGFVSNPEELARLATPSYQRALAQNLVAGILKWQSIIAKSTSGTVTSAIAKNPSCLIH